MSTASISVGANAQGYKAGIDSMRAAHTSWRNDARSTAAAINRELSGVRGPGAPILQNQGKIKGAIRGLVSDFANFQSPAQAVAGTLSNIGNIFHTSLGIGVVGALGGALISAGVESNEAWKNLRLQLDAAAEASKGDRFKGLSTLASEATQATAALKLANIELEKTSGFGGALRGIGRALVTGKGRDEQQMDRENLVRDATNQITGKVTAMAISEQKAADLAELRASGQDHVADSMERQLSLAQDIAAIESAAGTTKEAHAAAALAIEERRRRFAIEEADAEDKRKQKIQTEQDKVNADRAQRSLSAFDKSVDDAMKPASQRAKEKSDKRRRSRKEREFIERDEAKNDPDWNRKTGVEKQEIIRRRQGNIEKVRKTAEAILLEKIENSMRELKNAVGVV